MNSGLVRFYCLVLSLAPPTYRAEFSEEMKAVFEKVLAREARRGRIGIWAAAGRELVSLSGVIVRLQMAFLGGRLAFLKEHGSEWVVRKITDLPAAQKDGRSSGWQSGLEVLVFAWMAGLLLWEGYFQGVVPRPWDMSFRVAIYVMGMLILPLGIMRGLPRWAYPPGGLLAGYAVLSASQMGLLAILLFLMICALGLALLTFHVHARVGIQDERLQRMSAGLTLDPTRLSFAAYGLLPLMLFTAYDHSYALGRTPALAVSAAAMLLGALAYSRSQGRPAQLAALVGGLLLSLAPAFSELHYLRGGLWPSDLAWIVRLGLGALALLLLPAWIQLAQPPLRRLMKGG